MAEYVNESTSSIPFPTSKYLSDSSVFYRDGKAPLLVLVEDEDDRNFWNKMFACLADDYLSIDIHPLKSISAMAMAQSNAAGRILDATGKDPLMKVAGLGKNKVVAVDADYDLLVDYHSYSERIRTDRYVIHTTYYSIENHLLTVDSIKNLSIWKDLGTFVPRVDWEGICGCLAKAVGNAVKLCVASLVHRQKQVEQGITSLPETLHIGEVRSSLGCMKFPPQKYVAELSDWQSSFETTAGYKSIEQECGDEIEALTDWNEEYVLHNLQGHTLYEYLCKPLKYYYVQGYKRLEKSEKEKSTNPADIPDIIKQLKNSLGLNSMTVMEKIKSSIYSAKAIDMTDEAIVNIQSDIRSILI